MTFLQVGKKKQQKVAVGILLRVDLELTCAASHVATDTQLAPFYSTAHAAEVGRCDGTPAPARGQSDRCRALLR